ncbi:hypothetical protein RJ640_014916 [Escallonia rubra]|uniref:Uncharacterized protein n=1 Tax=Escallonia rubra TaxID=112253 RepID=A0AA88S605_9ASTE|nr:hypothetical protein RJ640_014916 [Escallonia rubra]
MASPFGFQVVILIMAFMASTSLCVKTPTVPITSAPALLPSASTSPLSSPSTSTELSPDVSPLLPSPGGGVPSSSIPTIPSNPSPPNPDETPAFGPDSAFSPSGSQPDSAAVPLSSVRDLDFAVLIPIINGHPSETQPLQGMRPSDIPRLNLHPHRGEVCPNTVNSPSPFGSKIAGGTMNGVPLEDVKRR